MTRRVNELILTQLYYMTAITGVYCFSAVRNNPYRCISLPMAAIFIRKKTDVRNVRFTEIVYLILSAVRNKLSVKTRLYFYKIYVSNEDFVQIKWSSSSKTNRTIYIPA